MSDVNEWKVKEEGAAEGGEGVEWKVAEEGAAEGGEGVEWKVAERRREVDLSDDVEEEGAQDTQDIDYRASAGSPQD